VCVCVCVCVYVLHDYKWASVGEFFYDRNTKLGTQSVCVCMITKI
jgi:hypothetical protein